MPELLSGQVAEISAGGVLFHIAVMGLQRSIVGFRLSNRLSYLNRFTAGFQKIFQPIFLTCIPLIAPFK